MAGPVRVRISRHFAATRNRQAPARDGGKSSGLGRRQLVARVDDEAVVREPLPVRLARAGVRVRQGAGVFCIFFVELVYFNEPSGGVCISRQYAKS